MAQTLTVPESAPSPLTARERHVQRVADSLGMSFEEAQALLHKTDQINQEGCVVVDEHGDVLPQPPRLITDARP